MIRFGLALLLLSSPAFAAAGVYNNDSKSVFRLHLQYIDILGPEMIGEIGARRYDVSRSSVHLGNLDLQGGQMLGAGIGLRTVFAALSGVRMGFEMSYWAGRFREDSILLPEAGTISRAEVLGHIGLEGTIGEIFTIHTATVIGVDYASFKGKPSLYYTAAISSPEAGGSTTVMSEPKLASTSLSNTSFRFGQQVGVHIQIAHIAALFADGTVDWDGQWRVRLGIAIGRPITKKTVDDPDGNPFRGKPRNRY